MEENVKRIQMKTSVRVFQVERRRGTYKTFCAENSKKKKKFPNAWIKMKKKNSAFIIFDWFSSIKLFSIFFFFFTWNIVIITMSGGLKFIGTWNVQIMVNAVTTTFH